MLSVSSLGIDGSQLPPTMTGELNNPHNGKVGCLALSLVLRHFPSISLCSKQPSRPARSLEDLYGCMELFLKWQAGQKVKVQANEI